MSVGVTDEEYAKLRRERDELQRRLDNTWRSHTARVQERDELLVALQDYQTTLEIALANVKLATAKAGGAP